MSKEWQSQNFTDIARFTSGQGTFVGDARYYPLVIADMAGIPDVALIDYFFLKWRDPITTYAASKNQVVAVIVNVNFRPPPANVRKAAGDHAAKDASTPGLLGTNLVVSNGLLRGVMTAVVWVAGSENTNVRYSATLQQAIDQSLQELKAAGVPLPNIDAATYEVPS